MLGKKQNDPKPINQMQQPEKKKKKRKQKKKNPIPLRQLPNLNHPPKKIRQTLPLLLLLLHQEK